MLRPKLTLTPVTNRSMRQAGGGFTLIEILTVISIVAIMASLTMGVLSGARKKADMMEDVNAGRSLITAYLAYASENNGELMPAMDNSGGVTVTTPDGTTYGSPIASRYTFRLASYLGNSFEGTIITKANRATYKAATSKYWGDYTSSVFPSFGINQYFVGGIVSSSPEGRKVTFDADCAQKLSQLPASPIIAFATATGSTTGLEGAHGYFYVLPPKSFAPIWPAAAWTPSSIPGSYGNVHPRHGGKAVTAMTDGSVKTYDMVELRDMRLWNMNAAQEGKEDYTAARP